MITCCSSRCTYLDIVPDCYGHSCIDILKRFISDHGAPKLIISDNRPTFSDEVKTFTSSRGITWKPNIQKATWMGGIFERMIRCTKQCLGKALGNVRVNYQGLLTILKEIENVFNNPPLTIVYYDEILQPFTPNKLIYGHNINTEVKDNQYEDINEELARDLTKRFIYMKKLFEHFKSRWTNEYLRDLREHHHDNKNKKYVLHPSVGDVVIIHEDVLKRCDWRIEKIIELIKSKDDKIRSAKVDVISTDKIMTLKRPINKLFPV